MGVRIRLGDRLFDQPQRLVRLSPGLQGWLRQATPPGFVLETECPGRVGGRQVDQAVACTFFRAYAGSGLVSQCWARFQPTPRRFKVARIVSPLTGSAVTPCSKLTLAATARVHRLVGWLVERARTLVQPGAQRLSLVGTESRPEGVGPPRA